MPNESRKDYLIEGKIKNYLWAPGDELLVFVVLEMIGLLFLMHVIIPQFMPFYSITEMYIVFFISAVIIPFPVFYFSCLCRKSVKKFTGVVFIIWFFIATIYINSLMLALVMKSGWEDNDCELILKALASRQLEYAELNDGAFGRWNELVKADIIKEGWSRSNIIFFYSIAAFNVLNPGENNDKSSFEIIAVPNNVNFKLKTFGICEDQTLRVWRGKKDDWSIKNITSVRLKIKA